MFRPRLTGLTAIRTALGAIAAALLFALPTLAVAATAENFTVVIGGPGSDVINEAGQPGNYRLWGLGGFNALVGGRGDNYLIGNGQCPPGDDNTQGNDNSQGNWDDYCSAEQSRGAPGAILVGGQGQNTIIASGGPNLIITGPDAPGQGFGNVIQGGPVGDVIAAVQGSSSIDAGPGRNLIDARGPSSDTIRCVPGDTGTVVYAEPYDRISNCARVIDANPPASLTPPSHPVLSAAGLSQAAAMLARSTFGERVTRAAHSGRHHTASRHRAARHAAARQHRTRRRGRRRLSHP